MPTSKGRLDPVKVISTCTWCRKRIPKGSEVFSLGAKVKSGLDLQGQEGHAMQLLLAKSGKTVTAIVPTHDSQAKKEGHDLLFAICSRQCGMALKKVLQEELDLFDRVN